MQATGSTDAGTETTAVRVPGPSVPFEQENDTIAPGMELTTFGSLEADGWTSGSVLTVDTEAGVTFDYQYSGSVTEPATVREGAERTGATAAINADFFDINNSNAPLGPGVSRDEGLVTSPVPGRNQALAVTEAGAVQLVEIFLEGTLTVEDGPSIDLDGVNSHQLPTDGVGVFTSQWGSYTRAQSVGSASATAEVTIADGVITEVGDEIGEGSIDDGSVVVVGRDDAAETLLDLEPGTAATVTYAPKSDIGEIATAVGGNPVLVRDGEPQSFGNTAVHPRSAVGISEDGSEIFMVVIDGRQAHARGMSFAELADFMIELGAHDAINIDGGGSSTLVVREPATVDHGVVNSPSDGTERHVANALAVFAAEGSGTLSGLRVAADSGSNRVFPGFTRVVTALGHDEAQEPVDAEPEWSSDGGAVKADGVGQQVSITGVEPGTATIAAADGEVRGEMELTVLDELAWVEPNTTLVPLAEAGSSGRIELTGYDDAGYQAPIEAQDIEVSGAGDVVDVEADGTGFNVTAATDHGSALLTLRAGDLETQVAVTVGLVEQTVADFSDADEWTISFARASGDIEPVEGPDGRPAVQMTYDFTGPNTRAAYAAPPERFELPGQPQAVRAWVRGDGNGSWIRMRLYDRDGALITLNGGYTDFTGWRQLTFPVPKGTTYPLTFRDVYSVEPRGDARYHGETAFSEITVDVAPDVELPVPTRFPDPVVMTDGTTDGSAQRIAVMNDAQFVARNPDSDNAQAARRTLREIVAADPDVLIINGDLVDEAAPEDFAFARELLEEELGEADFPWYYVPGNHEVQGGPIENFEAESGETQHVIDVDGTRIITLNTAFGTLRAGGREFDQLVALREALDEAAGDDSITGVVVAGHHPPHDPLPTANSQLGDRREVAMLESWLADFYAETGKPTAYVGGHAGVFDASSLDGVPYLVVGNSGKGPSGAPEDGGFTGWAMLGIEPQATEKDYWLAAEVRPRVDELELDLPDRMVVGSTVSQPATVRQDDTRTVPVAWPMSADWSGRRVHVGAADDAHPRDALAVDPVTGTVTALRPGAAMVSLTVNGETVTERVLVAPR